MILIIGGKFQGKTDFAQRRYPEYERIVHFEENIRACVKKKQDVKEYTTRYIQEHPEAVIIMDEVGCGIVPVEKEERKWREAVGRAGCILAKSAAEVYRIMAGMAVRLK
nr:bifunctional adenosylcobinamide kinase/adenosylcobinamide-phosphate guanylyltransferase [uncultured Sellimonas sp.]